MNESLEKYKKDVEGFDSATLEDVLSHINREAYPEKYQIVRNEWDRRIGSKQLPVGEPGTGPSQGGRRTVRTSPGVFIWIGLLLMVTGAWELVAVYSTTAMDGFMQGKPPFLDKEAKARIAEQRRFGELLGSGALVSGIALFAFGRVRKAREARREQE